MGNWADYSCLSTTLSLALFFFIFMGLQQVDPFFGNTQQMYTRLSSLHDNYPARVLLKVETRYASVLARNRVRKLLIFSGWHSSHQNHDMHYTLRGYNWEGWMVVMLEMKAGNVGNVFAYGHHAHRQWLYNAHRYGYPLAPKHIFRAREHGEVHFCCLLPSVSKLGEIGIEYLVYQLLSTYQISGLDMDGIAIMSFQFIDNDNGNIASFGHSQFEPTIEYLVFLGFFSGHFCKLEVHLHTLAWIINGLCVDLHHGTYYYKFAYTNKTCFHNLALVTGPNILAGFPRPLQSHYNPLPISIGHLL
ncbi:hypothetical protein IW261DRAFT_1598806 [Armillaria novae-zelandiae]|uniref:Uncharacterized protein n=1 Tax=Armillaria novae-zelandiae TaxID=153914 RepID=A0AA39NE74_9AGAR|nr:hypothetical protein IW261DRAFT_1598806 [Armillaria novae-zelandiae]